MRRCSRGRRNEFASVTTPRMHVDVHRTAQALLVGSDCAQVLPSGQHNASAVQAELQDNSTPSVRLRSQLWSWSVGLEPKKDTLQSELTRHTVSIGVVTSYITESYRNLYKFNVKQVCGALAAAGLQDLWIPTSNLQHIMATDWQQESSNVHERYATLSRLPITTTATLSYLQVPDYFHLFVSAPDRLTDHNKCIRACHCM